MRVTYCVFAARFAVTFFGSALRYDTGSCSNQGVSENLLQPGYNRLLTSVTLIHVSPKHLRLQSAILCFALMGTAAKAQAQTPCTLN